ncbi:suppressor of mec-8 and unc-52 protein 2 [Pelomyxa schiedti]|nr:suppressor of mec-8 and unc-52 protein 2 [Pelomyxa schiedti]
MEEREKDTPEQRKPLPEPTPAIAMHSPMARRVYKILFSAPLITSFNTSDNTSVATAATIQAHQQDQHDQSHTLDFFIGGRMVYHFPVDERAPDMPTTIISSKTTAAQDEAMMTGRIDNNIMDKILKVMTSLRVAPKGRRRRKDKESPTMTPTKPPPTTVTTPTISAPLDNEDSIFPDVGDYIFSTKDKEDSSKAPTSTTSTPTQPVAPPKSYFERSTEEAPAPTDPKATASLILAQARVMSLDLESQNPNQNQSQNKNPDPANQSSGSHPPTAERTKPTALLPTPNLPQTSPPPSSPQKDLNTPKQTTKASPGGAPPQASHHNQPPSKPDPTKLDPYFECYPGAFESTSFGADSDEDEDVSKMDQGPKGKNRLKRWDFDTEEGWEKYNQTREAMPRAAFQFGVKMADGRKTRKQKEAKLDKDMKKINDLIKVMAQTENSMEAAITDPTTSSMRLRAHEDGENENEDDPSQPRKRLRL